MVGIFSWYGIPLGFEERVKAISAAGFDSTSVWIGPEEEQWRTAPRDIPAIVRDNGLNLEYAHAPYTDANDIWDENRSGAVEREMLGCLDYCAEFGIRTLVIHLTKGYRVLEATEHGIEALRRLVAYASARGVRIAAENTKQNRVLESLFLAIPDEALGLCFDSSHDNLYSEKKLELMEKYHDRLMCLHISDNNGHADDHWTPYQGKIDWDSFMSRFPGDFHGTINLEIVPRDGKDAEGDFLGRAYGIARGLENGIVGRKGRL